MNDQFLHGLRLQGLLSFGPESPEVALTPLNVLIGPNASGKSNFIEALELLHATLADLADPLRIGGGLSEWLWKGASPPKPAVVTARLSLPQVLLPPERIYLHEDGLRTPVPGTRVSDGTLRFLALLAVLLSPGAASLVCIEEPELGLHPDALAILAELLVEASQQTQVVVTTHSDALVSALTEHADSVLITEPGPTGTELRRLESEKLQHWLSKYRLGDIWRMGKLGGNL
jgi:predicted ATPase